MKTKEKYQSITRLKNKKHSIPMLCKLFEVSPSGYFSSLKMPISPRKNRRENLKKNHKYFYSAQKPLRQT